MELTVALDNDDVLINFIPTLVDKYNEKYGTNFTVENDVTDWKIDNTKFTHGLFQLLEDPNIILEMKIKSEIIKDVLEKYHNKGVHFILVSATEENNTFDKKVELLRKYNIDKYFDKFVNTDCKHIVSADVLVDDYIGNLDNYKKYHPLAYTILFSAPHNKSIKSSIHTRVDNWEELDYCLGEILNYYENL